MRIVINHKRTVPNGPSRSERRSLRVSLRSMYRSFKVDNPIHGSLRVRKPAASCSRMAFWRGTACAVQRRHLLAAQVEQILIGQGDIRPRHRRGAASPSVVGRLYQHHN